MPHSVMNKEGLIEVPQEIRDALNLREGDRLDFRVQGGNRVVLQRGSSIDDVAGCLRGEIKRPVATFEEERAAAIKAWAEHAAHEGLEDA